MYLRSFLFDATPPSFILKIKHFILLLMLAHAFGQLLETKEGTRFTHHPTEINLSTRFQVFKDKLHNKRR